METRDVLPAPTVITAPRTAPAPPGPPALAPPRGVTWRAILLGLALIPFNCYWVGMIEGVWHGLHFTCLSLAMNVVFLLLALVVANVLLHRFRPESALSQGELLTIFSMLALSSILCGHDRLVTLMGVIA